MCMRVYALCVLCVYACIVSVCILCVWVSVFVSMDTRVPDLMEGLAFAHGLAALHYPMDPYGRSGLDPYRPYGHWNTEP